MKYYKSKSNYTVNKEIKGAYSLIFAASDFKFLSSLREKAVFPKGYKAEAAGEPGKKELALKATLRRVFQGSPGEVLFIPEKKIILLGIGPAPAGDNAQTALENQMVAALRKFSPRLPEMEGRGINLLLDNNCQAIARKPERFLQLAVQALELGMTNLKLLPGKEAGEKKPARKGLRPQFNFELKKTSPGEKELKTTLDQAQIIAQATNRAREIASLPGNHFRPRDFEKYACKIAKPDSHVELTVVKGDKDLKRHQLGGIIAVSRGSKEGGRLIVLDYKPGGKAREAPTLCLVGKGLTFDTGGISLKPPPEMHEMKYDMCGGAAVLMAMEAISGLKLPIRVVGIVAAAENMPGSAAFKPGDVFTSHKGLTVEVQNTDAEGRLVLCDALSWSAQYKPDYLVDLATLTGAIIFSLGDNAAGLFGNDRKFNRTLQKIGDQTLDPLWELPLYPEYLEQLKSDIADIRNIGGRPAGSATAAKFLEQFIPEKTKWAHLDIAGTAWVKTQKGLMHPGATGFGVRLLVELAKKLRNQKKKKASKK